MLDKKYFSVPQFGSSVELILLLGYLYVHELFPANMQ